MKFFVSSNNGVVAVISEDHAKLYAIVKKAGGDPTAAGCRVFTFCSKQRMESGIDECMVFSGTYDDLNHLINAGRHELQDYGSHGWDGYVPFSNGIQSMAILWVAIVLERSVRVSSGNCATSPR